MIANILILATTFILSLANKAIGELASIRESGPKGIAFDTKPGFDAQAKPFARIQRNVAQTSIVIIEVRFGKLREISRTIGPEIAQPRHLVNVDA